MQKKALSFGMSLKDCSAYNIQFIRGKPALIDTLSFEEYKEARPWVAYRQFCRHFLAPLSLMSRIDLRLNGLLRIHIDGIPLGLASALLPPGSRFDLSLLIHIHLHAGAERHYGNRPAGSRKEGRMPRVSFMGLIDSLERAPSC